MWLAAAYSSLLMRQSQLAKHGQDESVGRDGIDVASTLKAGLFASIAAKLLSDTQAAASTVQPTQEELGQRPRSGLRSKLSSNRARARTGLSNRRRRQGPEKLQAGHH